MGQSSFAKNPSIGYTLGAFGYTKDLSREFYEKQEEIKLRRIIFRQNDPTPKDYNILDDMDIFLSFNSQYGKGIFYCRNH